MDIHIEGNPGTGNTFSETHIDYVQNYNPNAKTVINNNYGTRPKKVEDKQPVNDNVDNSHIREEILAYVSRLKSDLSTEWMQRYDKLWNDILDLPEVSAKVYSPGKQQDTNFNRNLVANIIHYLGMHGAFGDYNAAKLAEVLEGDKDHSVRKKLGEDPEQDIANKINNLISKPKK